MQQYTTKLKIKLLTNKNVTDSTCQLKAKQLQGINRNIEAIFKYLKIKINLKKALSQIWFKKLLYAFCFFNNAQIFCLGIISMARMSRNH